MRLLLDTHTIAWWAEGSDDLPSQMRDLIDHASNVVHVSAVSACELALKHRLGKWPTANLLLATLETLVEEDFTALPITFAHAAVAGQLPTAHRDPFDRLLAAQALVEDLTIVSIDDKLDRFGVRRLW